MESEFDVTFAGNILNHIPYVYFTRRFPNDIPEMDFNVHDMVRQDGQINLGKRYKAKQIPFMVFIVAPNREQYELALDTLKKRTRGLNQSLVIGQGGANRQYTATLKTLTHTHIEQGKASLVCVFEASYPFGIDTVPTVFEVNGITESPFTDDTPLDGSAPAKPTITLLVNSFTGGGTRDMSIFNLRTGQGITMSRSGWEIGDSVQFFLKQKYVAINGAFHDYQGVFTEFEPDSDFISYSDTFTDRDVDMTVSYLREFL